MITELTLGIIKPDAVYNCHTGGVITAASAAGFDLVDMKMCYLTKAQACDFYIEHKDKHFYNRLTDFMSSCPSIFMVLKKPNAIEDWRELIGPTSIDDAREKSPMSIRAKFGRLARPLHENVVHGSDSPKSAARELNYFYDELYYYRGRYI